MEAGGLIVLGTPNILSPRPKSGALGFKLGAPAPGGLADITPVDEMGIDGICGWLEKPGVLMELVRPGWLNLPPVNPEPNVSEPNLEDLEPTNPAAREELSGSGMPEATLEVTWVIMS